MKNRIAAALDLIRMRLYGLSSVPSMPSVVHVDPVDFCVLKCPICPTGSGTNKYKQSVMPLELFRKVLDDMPLLAEVHLYNWGEPFLNPRIIEMIRMAKQRRIKTVIHSNLNIRKDEAFWRGIVEAGLDELCASLDGATQASYQVYRIGGDLELALGNIRAINEAKKALGSKTPALTWKFIVHRHNEHEIEKARAMSKMLGMDFTTSTMGVGDLNPHEEPEDLEARKAFWLPAGNQFIDKRYRKDRTLSTHCTYLWRRPAVSPSGKVYPCCLVKDESFAFGDMSEESFQSIWHNDKYRYSRSLFGARKYGGPAVPTICASCRLYKKKR